MSNFAMGRNVAGPPSYQLSGARRPVVVTATDGVPIQISETYRIQSIKMPDYSRFASNVLSLPANDYTFSLEQTVISKYQAEEKAAAAAKAAAQDQLNRNNAATKSTPVSANDRSYPIPIPAGDLLRPSAAASTPRSSTQDNYSSRPSAVGTNEWADFERPHDLFDDLELKSIDDRHELASVLVNNSQGITDSAAKSNQNAVPNAPSALNALVDDHKKMSLSDNNLAATVLAGGENRNSPAPAPSGPFYSSSFDLSRSTGLPRHLPRSSPPPVALTPAQQTTVTQTVAMGFDRLLCSKLANGLNTDSHELLANAVIAHSSLVASGYSTENAERALVLFEGDESKARTVLEACSYLEQLGFGREKIFAAVARLTGSGKSASVGPSDELRDKLLDMLTAENL